jgi:hypothetical protein
MTGQVDILRHKRIKALGVDVIVIAATIIIMTTLASISELSVNAQMMGNHGGVWAGNMTSGQQLQQQQDHDQKTVINGSINLEQIIFQAINARINTSLTQAMSTAERSIGNDAFAVAAFGSEEGGYFTYRIILATPEMNFYWVKVDPGNGQVLETEEVSQKELDTMHREHSAMVVSNNGGGRDGISGFPLIIPH